MTSCARPERLVVVLGTGTGVGKTWVTAAVVAQLGRHGIRAAARKPAQSFRPGETTDAEVLGRAGDELPEAVCLPSRSYEIPLAPPMAADALGRPAFTIEDLVHELAWPAGIEVGVVEGVGGVRSPLADDGDAVDLLVALRPDLVVLVADAGLGTLNLVRMSVDALVGHRTVVYLNRLDPRDELHRRNRSWLVDRWGLPVAGDLDDLLARITP